MNYASDLHRKGELNKIEEMQGLADQLESKTKGGLAGAYLTGGYKGYDAIAMLANKKEYSDKEGFVLFDNEASKAIFIEDDED